MLSKEERALVDDIHNFMSYTNNLITDSNGNQIKNIKYNEIPQNSTILLFGGYKSIGFYAADAMKSYYGKYKEWPNIIITGKSSNKFDNTAGLGSEVNAYHYILENCGIPKNIVRKHYVEPVDTSTAENIQSVDKILQTFPHLQNNPLVLFTQSYYSRRAAHDFAQKLPSAQLIVANLPKADLDNGLFYNDRADGNAIDVMLGACFYQSMFNQTRWQNGETVAPTTEELDIAPKKENIVSILQKYCGWLYPNNMVDLGLAKDLLEGKKIIDDRKAELFSKPEFQPEQQKKDIINAVQLYRKQHSLDISYNR